MTTGPIREVFQKVMNDSMRQGIIIGHLDVASSALNQVLEEAKANLRRNPKHELIARAVNDLTRALGIVNGLGDTLEQVASGKESVSS